MSEDHADQTNANFNQFASKYRLWLAIPLAIAAITALWSRSAALGFLIFMLCFWGFIGVIRLILWGTGNLLSKRSSIESLEAIQGSIGATLFLGGCALLGMVLRGENAVSNALAKTKPDGVSLGFIDPIFALVCIVLIWAYTAYRIRK
jgi:hypothetical protein